jgi:hypothetical protein
MPSVIFYIFLLTMLLVVTTAPIALILDRGLIAEHTADIAYEIFLTALAEDGIAPARVATEDAERALRATVNNVSIEVGDGDNGKYIVWLASPEADAWRADVVKELYASMTDADWQTSSDDRGARLQQCRGAFLDPTGYRGDARQPVQSTPGPERRNPWPDGADDDDDGDHDDPQRPDWTICWTQYTRWRWIP